MSFLVLDICSKPDFLKQHNVYIMSLQIGQSATLVGLSSFLKETLVYDNKKSMIESANAKENTDKYLSISFFTPPRNR